MRENSLHKGTALGRSLGDLGQGELLFLCPSGTGSGAGVGWSSSLLSLPQRGAVLGVENQGGLQRGPRQRGTVSLAPPRRSSGRLSVTTGGIYCFMSAHICFTLCDFAPWPQICNWPANSIQVLVTAFLGRVYLVPLEVPSASLNTSCNLPPASAPRLSGLSVNFCGRAFLRRLTGLGLPSDLAPWLPLPTLLGVLWRLLFIKF